MSTTVRSGMTGLLAAVLIGVSACSDDDGANGKIGTGGLAAKPQQAVSPDLTPGQATGADATSGDIALAAKVTAEILRDASLRTSDIYVDARDGTVLLSGTVNTSRDARRAIEIARSVEDVRSVVSRLGIRSET